MPVVIDSNNVIVCGHTRYKAAQKLGLDTVPCVIADDLTDEQIKAYRLADNKVSELAEWVLARYGREKDGMRGYLRYENSSGIKSKHLQRSASTKRVTYSFWYKGGA